LAWDYADFRLQDALDRSRRLVATSSEATDTEQRAELYQYLALLHHAREVYIDSIDYYTQAAEDLLSSRSTPHLRARQMLCRGVNGFEDYAWVNMQMLTQYGRRLVEAVGEEHGMLYAQLLYIGARATKKYADQSDDEDLRRRVYAEAIGQLERAVRIAAAHGSAWENVFLAHLAIVRFRTGIDDLRQVTVPRGLEGERLRGYFHFTRSQTDSVEHYYKRVLTDADHFRKRPRDEANFFLKGIHLRRGDFPAALRYNLAAVEEQACCPPGVRAGEGDNLLRCTRSANCTYFMSAIAEIYRQWHRAEGAETHADRAYRYTQAALEGYEQTFREHRQQAVLNKNLDIGDRLITTALLTAAERAEATGEARYREGVLRAMEFGQTVLLTRELLDAERAASREGDRGPERQLRELQVRIAQWEDRFLEELHLPREQLAQYAEATLAESRLMRQRERLIADKSAMLPSPTVPTLEGIGGELEEGQAFLQFAEAGDLLIALYVDRAGSAVYRVDTLSVFPKIRQFQSYLSNRGGKTLPDARGLSYGIFRELFGPIRERLDKRKELLIAPSPALIDLPLAALLTDSVSGEATLPYLLFHHRIRYVASWRSERQLARLRERSPATPRIGLWTHPGLQNYFSSLNQRLLERLPGDHYYGSASTPASLLRRAGQYDWLQLSVHAAGDPHRLGENYLYLNATDSLNGIFIGQQILPARLVVLAACSTARGYANRREGTYSIRRSFHRAGVADVVASLYDIPAPATAAILETFYDELLTGASPAAALAAAQRQCASGELGDRWRHPGYWAGLICG
jgi:hypothetical protein